MQAAGVHAQILGPTTNTVPYRETADGPEEVLIEDGFVIKIFNVEPTREAFWAKVWGPLKRLMDIECAHVDTSNYRGCVSNWPGIMVESRCNVRGVRRTPPLRRSVRITEPDEKQ